MATVSTRVDDRVKAEAESIADAIGLPLSTAINIFLKRFAAAGGFPFDVIAPEKIDTALDLSKAHFDRDELENRMQAAVLEANIQSSKTPSNHFTYIDPNTKKPVTVF